MKTKIIQFALLIAVIFFIISIPASAQLPGDLNCNGFQWELGDAVFAARIMIESCDMDILNCTYINGDMDGDGTPLTIGDFITMFFIINGGGNLPDYPRHPDSDTIMVESATTHPGETIVLPLRIKTVDTLVQSFQEYKTQNDVRFDTISQDVAAKSARLEQYEISKNRPQGSALHLS